MYCPYCNTYLADDVMMCPNCGTQFDVYNNMQNVPQNNAQSGFYQSPQAGQLNQMMNYGQAYQNVPNQQGRGRISILLTILSILLPWAGIILGILARAHGNRRAAKVYITIGVIRIVIGLLISIGCIFGFVGDLGSWVVKIGMGS